MWPLLLAACGTVDTCEAELWFVDDGRATDVSMIGPFNDWAPDADPLREVHPGAWHAVLELPPGDYEYMLRVDGRPTLDLYSPLLAWDDTRGTERSVLRVPDCTVPALAVDEVAVRGGALRASATLQRARSGARLASASATLDGVRVRSTVDGDTISVRAPTSPGKHALRIEVTDEDGATTWVAIPFWDEDHPFEWSDAVIYQVMVDRFASEDGQLAPPPQPGARAGGTLAGVRARLDEGWFDDLGVNVLWLSPVYPNPDGAFPTNAGNPMEGYHGYWPVSPDGVDARLGTQADLAALVDAAHARGMRVLLDVVPNHVHAEHPWAVEDWFHDGCVCGTPECAWSETCAFAEYLPDLDFEAPGAAEAAADAVVALAEATNVDGLRVDAVPMMPRAFNRELVWRLAQRFERGPTDFFLLGETFTGPGGWADIRRNLGPHGLDSQFDFPVMWALRAHAAWGPPDAAALADTIATSLAEWEGSGAVMANFVGNHDVSRFVSEAAGQTTGSPWTVHPPQPTGRAAYERLVLAQAVVFTLPGAPVLWQGDELGLAGATDPDCRRPVPFDDHTADMAWVHDQTARLGRARACSVPLRRGRWSTLIADGQVFAAERDAELAGRAVLVTNAGDTPAVASLDLTGAYVDVLAQAGALIVDGPTDLELAPRQAVLLLPAASACAEMP